jgi:hypothetical protein
MHTGDLLQQLRLESAQFQLTDIAAKLSAARKLQAESPQPLRLLSIYNNEARLPVPILRKHNIKRIAEAE